MNFKSIFLTVIVTGVFSSQCNAQTNIFPSTGNVGIGTTSPIYQIDELKKGNK